MNSTHITYTRRSDATSEAEVAALVAIYKFVLDCHAKKMAAEPTPGPDGRNDAAIVRDTKEVSHVEQRHDRPSEIT
jgi:hypothetical protein